jgi:energy-converting hydrogenase Eha subunit A
MQSFLDLYLDWSGPNVIAALAAASIVWLLTTLKRPRHIQHYFLAVGTGVIAVIVVSAAAAMFGISPKLPSGMLGIIAGVVSALLLRPRTGT